MSPELRKIAAAERGWCEETGLMSGRVAGAVWKVLERIARPGRPPLLTRVL